jgi:PadR family transcriptional regulator PadR
MPKKETQRDLFPGALDDGDSRDVESAAAAWYARVQHIKRMANELLQMEEGSLYQALERLVKEELVKAEWGLSSTNRRVRVYKWTPAGARHLEREVSSFEQMLKGISRVLAPGEL